MKVALDTNILVRLIVKDDKVLVEKAARFIEKYDAKEIFIVYGVIFELYFVLRSGYKYPDAWIIDEIEELMRVDRFCFEHEVALRTAFMKCRKGQPFKDAIIGEIALARNVKTATFDKALKNNSSYIVI